MTYYTIEDYVPMTLPKSVAIAEIPERDLEFIKPYLLDKIRRNYYLVINGRYITRTIQYMGGEERVERVIVTDAGFKNLCKTLELLVSKEEFPIEVKNFEYNGFCGKELKGKAPYKAKFLKWTSDPGIMLAACSDGKERLLPTFALPGWIELWLPQPKPTDEKVLFGTASHS